MEYSKLVAVSGLPGLYELINSKTDGAIIRSLEDGNTKFASSRIHNFSHLESIEIYTTGENVNLVEIFNAMEKAGNLPDEKDNTAIKNYFEKVFPSLDFEKVYTSDLKKMVKWFDILKKKNIEIKLTEPEAEEESIEEVKPVGKEKTEKKKAITEESKPAPKSLKKEEKEKPATKESGKKATETKKEKTVEKKEPAKKSTAKKEEAPKKKAAPKKK